MLGVGGMGGVVAQVLARAGVGALSILDKDAFEPSNNNRQVYSNADTWGQLKVDVTAAELRKINPELEVRVEHHFGRDNVDRGARRRGRGGQRHGRARRLPPPLARRARAAHPARRRLERAAAQRLRPPPERSPARRSSSSTRRATSTSPRDVAPLARRVQAARVASTWPSTRARCATSTWQIIREIMTRRARPHQLRAHGVGRRA